MSDHRLQKWALFADVAGAIAVVVTLAFVVVEMRANTNALQAQTYQDLMQQVNDYRVLLLEYPRQEARAKMDSVGWESLTREEQQTLSLPTQILWAVYETAYYANVRGTLGEREWSRFVDGICRNRGSVLYEPGSDFNMDNLLTADFVAYIDSVSATTCQSLRQ